MREMTLSVTGMSCEHCARAVTSEVSAVAGVTEVVVDVAGGRVRVVGDRPLDAGAVRAAIEEAGYAVVA